MFGAHGGALDRLDALLFTVVVGYWVWRALLEGWRGPVSRTPTE